MNNGFSLFSFCQVDIVTPPSSWNIPPQDIPEFTHVNVIVDQVSLVDGFGVLGETTMIHRDVQGNPILESSGENGEGVLTLPPQAYERPSLI